jgi:hypothetical protein
MQGFSPTSNKAGRRSRLLTVHMFDAAGIQLINVRTAGLGDASDGSALVFDPSHVLGVLTSPSQEREYAVSRYQACCLYSHDGSHVVHVRHRFSYSAFRLVGTKYNHLPMTINLLFQNGSAKATSSSLQTYQAQT